MRFAPLVLDVPNDSVAARVDDALYTNATAPFGDLAKADRQYARMLVERIVTMWTGGLAAHRYTVTTTDALHEDGGDATIVVDDGAPIPLPTDGAASIVRDLRNLMDLAQGILRIDGGVPAAAKQKRGEMGD